MPVARRRRLVKICWNWIKVTHGFWSSSGSALSWILLGFWNFMAYTPLSRSG